MLASFTWTWLGYRLIVQIFLTHTELFDLRVNTDGVQRESYKTCHWHVKVLANPTYTDVWNCTAHSEVWNSVEWFSSCKMLLLPLKRQKSKCSRCKQAVCRGISCIFSHKSHNKNLIKGKINTGDTILCVIWPTIMGILVCVIIFQVNITHFKLHTVGKTNPMHT